MARFFGGVFLVGISAIASAFLYFPVAFTQNAWLVTGFFLFILASLISALVTYAKRKDSIAYPLAAAPIILFVIAAAIEDLLRRS